MIEKATLYYKTTPVIDLVYDNGVLVSKTNLLESHPLFMVDYYLTSPLELLHSDLLERRIAEGRPNRNKVYFEGKTLTPFEEMKYYNGKDRDDWIWIDFETQPRTFEQVFADVL